MYIFYNFPVLVKHHRSNLIMLSFAQVKCLKGSCKYRSVISNAVFSQAWSVCGASVDVHWIDITWHLRSFIERRQFTFPFMISLICCPTVKLVSTLNTLGKFPEQRNKR